VIARIRLFVLMVRPAVLLLLVMYLALGLAQAGGGQNPLLLAVPALVIVGFLLFSTALNDLADEAVDRVNLPTDSRRLLVSGARSRRDLGLVAATTGCLTVLAAATLGWQSAAVVVIGMTVSAGYSLPPTRLASRGAAAALLLPACYVAVPYLLGVFATTSAVTPGDLALLAGLYLGFIGRILLKDFRDVRGDALFGKRTFLVRHGRAATCRTSALFWVTGTLVIVATTRSISWTLVVVLGLLLAIAVLLLRQLAVDRGRRRDDALISTLAIVGRGMMLVLLGHLSVVNAGWSAVPSSVLVALLGVLTLGQAHDMMTRGPRLVAWRTEAMTATDVPAGESGLSR